jgi:hypothetical protein
MTAMTPIRITGDIHREIEVRAYLIWESEGRPHGRDAEHWARAEAEILAARMLARIKPAGAAKVADKSAPKAAAKKAEPKAAAKVPAKTKSKSAAKRKTTKPAK